jgi:16S rRNA (cytidine1402-2'-O)-methyltransferase
MSEAQIPSGLYVVATPIGNLKDITFRAVDTLQKCDFIACEDTRVSMKLLSTYGISKPLIVYQDHNAEESRPQIIEKLSSGQSVALISDAGTPLISDPGYKLVRACLEAGHKVIPIPGPSSVLSALVISGQPSDHFAFLGFIEERRLSEFASLPMTLIFFESARRLIKTLETLSQAMPERTVSVVRELTKIHEEVKHGSYDQVIDYYRETGKDRGEVVLVLSPPLRAAVSPQDLDAALEKALANNSVKDACALVAGALNLPKKQVYQRALELSHGKKQLL